VLGAPSARAQETFDSIAGVWWFKLAGKDAGAMLLEFSEPAAGSFTVEDVEFTGEPSFGFSRNLEAFFEVDAGQVLQLDSKRNVTGTLELTDPNGGVLADLVIEKGKPNKAFTKLKLKTTLGSQVVKLTGSRVPATFPVLTGIGPDGKLSGKKVKSNAFELQVLTDGEHGLPAYQFLGSGPAKIDGVEEPAVSIDGRVMLAPDKKIFGLLDASSDFGTGSASGKLSVPESGVTPKLKLKLVADRKVNAKGKLSDPTEPVLSVTPTTFDFGAVKLDAQKQQVFTVENVGVGTLSGIAVFQAGSSPEFSFTGGATFLDLENGDPGAEIEIEFDPATAGVKTAEVLFSPDVGAGARIVQLTGTGGVPEISIDPEIGEFDDTTVGQSDNITFTVTNIGDGPLTGTARITAGGADFTLIAAGAPVVSIPYTIAPLDTRLIIVRFTPTTAADKVGVVTFTGGGDVTATLTGTGL